MVPVCDKRYHIYNRFRHFGAEIKKLWNYPLFLIGLGRYGQQPYRYVFDTDLADTIHIRYDTHVHDLRF